MILLDTDVCIEILRGNKSVIEKRKTVNDDLFISFLTVAELYYGAEKSKNRMKNINLIEHFLLSMEIIESDLEICQKFGELKSRLEKNGNPIADADLFIASTALAKCNKLVTGNIKHFKRIEELTVVNWVK